MALPTLRRLLEGDSTATLVFQEKRYIGLCDCMELACNLMMRWKNQNIRPNMRNSFHESLNSIRKASVSASNPFTFVASQFGYTPLDLCIATPIVKKIAPKVEGTEADVKKNEAERKAAGLSPIAATRTIDSNEPKIRLVAKACLTSHFAWNMVYRFATGERSVPVASAADDKRDSFVHIMTQGEMAQWLSRRMFVFGDDAKSNLLRLVQKFPGFVRSPIVRARDDNAKDCFLAMCEKRCETVAIINPSNDKFEGEVRASERASEKESERVRASTNEHLSEITAQKLPSARVLDYRPKTPLCSLPPQNPPLLFSSLRP
jgi:hypothetical protein